MKSDVIALGFITSKEDAVLLRIDSGTSNDYMELELVSILLGGCYVVQTAFELRKAEWLSSC